MKPLSQRVKKTTYEWLIYGRLRWLAKPLYWALLTALLFIHRSVDYFYAKDVGDISKLTFIIKTFERPYAVRRLVKSIFSRYPHAKVMVVDDSKVPLTLAGVEMLIMPYDSGISAGRNAALDRCKSKYFLLLDDDFVFSHRQQLSPLCAYMDKHAAVDILGGRYLDLPLYIRHNFQKGSLHVGREPKVPLGQQIGAYEVVDKVQNYFIGRTKSIASVKWDAALKVMEHTEFFSRAKGQLCTVYNPEMLILHAKWPFDFAYAQKRFRAQTKS